MSLEQNDILNIVQRYRDEPEPSTIAELAKTYKVKDSSIRYHLKRAGAIGTPDGFETDADLGINEDDAPQIDFSALMSNPQFAKLLDAAVMARMANAGAPTAMTQGEDFKAFTETLKHMLEVQAMQQPGYQKPIPAEEMDRRANGYVEMRALLKQYEAQGNAPLYLLTATFFECTNAMTFAEGTQIRTFLPPAESFVPKNDAAERVYAAMFQWIGGKTPDIGDQVEAAMIASHQVAPLVGGATNAPHRSSLVQAVDAPKTDVSRKRVAGTLVPERRDVTMAERLAGPTLVGDFAA